MKQSKIDAAIIHLLQYKQNQDVSHINACDELLYQIIKEVESELRGEAV